MRSLQIRGIIYPTDDDVGSIICRYVIVYDKQSNGVAPTWANVISSQDIAGTVVSTVYSMVNLDNRDRFVIIRDKTLVMGKSVSTATQAYSTATSIIVKDYIKLKLPTIFNAGTAGTIGDITSGALYIFAIANQAAASGVTMTFTTRLRFDDQ